MTKKTSLETQQMFDEWLFVRFGEEFLNLCRIKAGGNPITVKIYHEVLEERENAINAKTIHTRTNTR